MEKSVSCASAKDLDASDIKLNNLVFAVTARSAWQKVPAILATLRLDCASVMSGTTTGSGRNVKRSIAQST
jgi:hypothetical protein